MIAQLTISRGGFRAWQFKQWRRHLRVHTCMSIHQYKHSSMRNVRVVPKWQHAVEWQSCTTQGRMRRWA